jgi:hypothetical protein
VFRPEYCPHATIHRHKQKAAVTRDRCFPVGSQPRPVSTLGHVMPASDSTHDRGPRFLSLQPRELGVPFWVGLDKQLVEPSRPGAPVPATVDRMLAEMAIEHMVRVNRPGLRQRPRVAKVIEWANRHRSLI